MEISTWDVQDYFYQFVRPVEIGSEDAAAQRQTGLRSSPSCGRHDALGWILCPESKRLSPRQRYRGRTLAIIPDRSLPENSSRPRTQMRSRACITSIPMEMPKSLVIYFDHVTTISLDLAPYTQLEDGLSLHSKAPPRSKRQSCRALCQIATLTKASTQA